MQEFWRGSIEGLKTGWPHGIVTVFLAALTVGLTGIFRWDREVETRLCPGTVSISLQANSASGGHVVGISWPGGSGCSGCSGFCSHSSPSALGN